MTTIEQYFSVRRRFSLLCWWIKSSNVHVTLHLKATQQCFPVLEYIFLTKWCLIILLFFTWESRINFICFICSGYYKYCLESIFCPNCIRQVYLNLFNRSVCLASLRKSQLDCKEHNFTQKFTAPSTAGSYDIKVMILSECIFAF